MMWSPLSPGSLASLLAGFLAGCVSSARPGLPPGSPFVALDGDQDGTVQYGPASGDVTHHSAVIWARTIGPTVVQVEWWPTMEGEDRDASGSATHPEARRTTPQATSAARDFTFKATLEGLQPDTTYQVRLWASPVGPEARLVRPAIASRVSVFRTAPRSDTHATVTFAWSGDLGGQGRCRQGDRQYPILTQLVRERPAFFLFLGDLIYGDESCPSPPNIGGSERPASTLDEYRAKHRYQHGAPSLQRLLAAVPLWAIWDDHEVRNNFSGPFDAQMPAGRQALLEYWPIEELKQDPTRLYRSVRYGQDLEVFILDTRQYRSRNQDLDGPQKTMLGAAQRAWLLEGVSRSTATWKVITTSVPLSHPSKAAPTNPGNDGWARGDDGSGFETELSTLIQAFKDRAVANLVWLAGDVHFVQGTAYDPDGDGVPDFHEFIAGPLSARPGRLVPVPLTFRPTVLFAETGYDNVGVVTVSREVFHVAIVDGDGRVRHQATISAAQRKGVE